MTRPTILGDADILVYTACYSSSDYLKAVECVDYYLDKLAELGDVRLFLSGKNNFRYDIAKITPYKANRKKEKPLQYKNIREYLIEHKGAEVSEEGEADDCLGINQTENTYIASIDKDLLQISGNHYHLKKFTTSYITEEEAFKNLCIQLLVGDSVDNIPGLKNPSKAHHAKPPNFSQATAEEYLKDHTVEDIKQLYIDQYGSIDAFTEVSSLLFIRRKDFTDFETFYQNYRLKTV